MADKRAARDGFFASAGKAVDESPEMAAAMNLVATLRKRTTRMLEPVIEPVEAAIRKGRAALRGK